MSPIAHPRKGRVLLSTLEHHSNIVPWQLAGWQVDVCPLTADGCIDLDAAEKLLTPEHTMVAFAHVSNVLGSPLDVARAAELAHRVGAELLIDGCQAVPRLPVDVAALGCDYYVFSGHKLYGPTGIGVLWSDKLDTLPPWQGGGSMIDRVTFERTTYAPAPTRFEAGTPAIIEAIGLAAAVDYVEAIGIDAIHAHECKLVGTLREALAPQEQHHVVRPRKQRRNRQLFDGGGSSARHRHYLGRKRGRDPRRAPLRTAADGASGRTRDRAREFWRVQQ